MSTNILDDANFSTWLRKIIDEKKLSFSKVADRSGKEISKSYIGFLANEDKFPGDFTLKKLVALANGLGVSPVELVNKALEDELRKTPNWNAAQELATKSKSKIPIKKEKSQKIHKKAG